MDIGRVGVGRVQNGPDNPYRISSLIAGFHAGSKILRYFGEGCWIGQKAGLLPSLLRPRQGLGNLGQLLAHMGLLRLGDRLGLAAVEVSPG